MIETLRNLPRSIRTFGERFFREFGIHCATHQIRVILISCVVITSLLYPALALYSSSQLHYLSRLRILTQDNHGFTAQEELVDLWAGHEAITHDKTAPRLLCGIERTLRVERILIQNPVQEDVLDYPVLLSVLNLEEAIQRRISEQKLPCLSSGGRCFSLSPLAFWGHDPKRVSLDPNIPHTLDSSKNISYAGITLTPSMVVAGRQYDEPEESHSEGARTLALTFFVTEDDCTGNAGHKAWLEVVQSASDLNAPFSFEPVRHKSEPTLISLQFQDSSTKTKELKLISLLTYCMYAVSLGYTTWSVRRMETAMHSCLGLAFTGLVEIAVSTITSLSVCALAGFKITLVPWELLPMILFVVGSENMVNLTEAVAKTSVTLPVKQRIAEGLSKAGTSNTLKLISYNTVLGVIAAFSTGAIQQFCAFAIVVLVAHWFLAHVFYVTVLSIDIQRLELDDLIRQEPSSAPSIGAHKSRVVNKTQTPLQKAWGKLQGLLKGRASKNLNLLLLLGVTALLYYTTYPAVSRHGADIPHVSPARQRLNASRVERTLPAQQTWNVLNPMHDPRLHLRIESPVILTYQSEAGESIPSERRSSMVWVSYKTLRTAYWFAEIVVLPIAATTGLLYFILLYLLKDADLLEAQRNRLEAEAENPVKSDPLADSYSFSTIPRDSVTDIDLLATSQDGRVIVSTSTQGEISVWQKRAFTYDRIDTSEMTSLLSSGSSTGYLITVAAVDPSGEFIAFGTRCGIIGSWSLEGATGATASVMKERSEPSPVTELAFTGSSRSSTLSLVASHKSGHTSRWLVRRDASRTLIPPRFGGNILSSTLLKLGTSGPLAIAFLMADGSFHLESLDVGDSTKLFEGSFQAGNPADPVSRLHACQTYLEGGERVIIAAATESGVISLWDAQLGDCITILDERYGNVGSIRVSHIFCEACHFCGEFPLESFSLAFSVDYVVIFFKAYMQSQTRRCTCSQNQPRPTPTWDASQGKRSRTNSTSGAPPSDLRQRGSASESTALFPVSSHGVHSRRGSDNGPRISGVSLSLPIPTLDLIEHSVPSPVFETGKVTPGNPPPSTSFWQKLTMRKEMEATVERGGWGLISDTKLVGIRRRSRITGNKGHLQPPSNAHIGSGLLGANRCLSPATLDRWEVWIYDPATVSLQHSPLGSLIHDLPPMPPSASRPCSPAPSRRTSLSSMTSNIKDGSVPRLPFTRASPVISGSKIFAGFGNTVGILENCPL